MLSRDDLAEVYWRVSGGTKADREKFDSMYPTKEQVFDAIMQHDKLQYDNKIVAAFSPKYRDLGKYDRAIDKIMKEKKAEQEKADFERAKLAEKLRCEKEESEAQQKRLRKPARALKIMRVEQSKVMAKSEKKAPNKVSQRAM